VSISNSKMSDEKQFFHRPREGETIMNQINHESIKRSSIF
jgi:hypothetical protein